ncbi:MAG: hypothetical protein JWO88_2234 [Frankiales bacterium]|nr:hypothetical protein [Frankiales bacterium]
MRAPARTSQVYLVLAMLLAAAAGRALDASALLPGVAEAAKVRGAGSAWLVALVAAGSVGAAAAARWSGTHSIKATATVVLPGQTAVFFAAEAVVRLANGEGPLDPDGLVGALLQAGVAVLLLLALTLAWFVALRCASPPTPTAPITRDRAHLQASPFLGNERSVSFLARGPPRILST